MDKKTYLAIGAGYSLACLPRTLDISKKNTSENGAIIGTVSEVCALAVTALIWPVALGWDSLVGLNKLEK